MIEFGHLTHVGLRRELNEDTYYGDSELGLWLIADGMGGHEYGEVASALAREAIVREIRQGTPLAQAIRIADEEIIRASRQRNDALPMGTTVVAARVQDNRFEVAWVGDSRVYLWHDGSFALAVIVFIASIVVPVTKLLVLSLLLISLQRQETRWLRQRLQAFRLLEMIGRWSMLDVFVVTMLSSLVQVESLAELEPRPGAIAFGAVVVLTMLATHAFDPRLLFDRAEDGAPAAATATAPPTAATPP